MISTTSEPTKFFPFVEHEMKKLLPVAQDRQGALVFYAMQLLTDKYPSIKRAAEASNGKFNINIIRQALNDLQFCQEIVANERSNQFKTFDKRKNVYLGLDDMTVSKTGKKIAFTQKLFDHTIKSFINGWLLFDISIKHDGKIYGTSYLIKPPQIKKRLLKDKKDLNEELRVTISAKIIKKVLKKLINELKDAGFTKSHIIVLVDRWYPSQQFFTFLRDVQVDFVVALKKTHKSCY